MITADSIAKLRLRTSTRGLVDRIVALDTVAGGLKFEVFREPVAITQYEESGNNRLVNLDAEYLTGWSHHLAYSMRVRLRALEPGIVDELSEGRALAAQVLLRSHLEAAAMAALCVETLREMDHKALSTLVPQTLFGTALFGKSKRDERVARMLTYAEQRTITISLALSALHKFMRPGGGPDDAGLVYSLLCEASHPNHRGTGMFVKTTKIDPASEFGWWIEYSSDESVPTELTNKLVETLILSMSAGYAATELLCNMQISNSDSGPKFDGVPEESGRTIWFDILQQAVMKKPRAARKRKSRQHSHKK